MFKPVTNFFKIFIILTLTVNYAEAKSLSYKKKINKEAFLVIDEKNQKILYNKHASERRRPASLTKILSLYITFDAIHQHKLRMNQKIPTSAYAASKPNTKLGLKPGEYITVKDAVLGLIIRSANDAAVVLAEAIGGSEANFAKIMNQYAKKLHMNNSNFVNASGLHDVKQYSTAMDMAKLAISIKKDFPEYYSLFSQTDFEFKGQLIKTTNNVTRVYPGAKGMKTGYIDASGYNLVTMAERADKKLVAVIFGGKSSKSRDQTMIKMLDEYFSASRANPIAGNSKKTRKIYSRTNLLKIKTKKNVISRIKPVSKLTNSRKENDRLLIINKEIDKF